jgi:hypothetical protein
MSAAVTQWVREREVFLSQAWTLAQYHRGFHDGGLAQGPPPLLSHPLYIAPS